MENSVKFSVFSHNILSNSRIRMSFSTQQNHYLDWNYRSEKLCLDMLTNEPDIVCLQEVESYDYFSQKLKNHHGNFDKTSDFPFGVSTFVKKNLFLFEETIKVPFVEKNFVGTIMVVSYHKRSKFLLISNVLFASVESSIQQPQLAILISIIDNTIKKIQKFSETAQIGILMCGDFNFLPYTPLYNSVLDSPLSFQSAYGEHFNNKEPDFTVYSDKKNQTQDFVFFSKNIFQHSFLSIPKPLSVLPSKDYPSDHFYLFCKMEF